MFGASFGATGGDVLITQRGMGQIPEVGTSPTLKTSYAQRYSDFSVTTPTLQEIDVVQSPSTITLAVTPGMVMSGRSFAVKVATVDSSVNTWHPDTGSIKSKDFWTLLQTTINADVGATNKQYSLDQKSAIAPADVTGINAAVMVGYVDSMTSQNVLLHHTGQMGPSTGTWSATQVGFYSTTSNIVWTGSEFVYIQRFGTTAGAGYCRRAVGSGTQTTVTFSNSTAAGAWIDHLVVLPDGRIVAFDVLGSTMYVSSDAGMNWTVLAAGSYHYNGAQVKALGQPVPYSAGKIVAAVTRAGTISRYQGITSTGALTAVFELPVFTDIGGDVSQFVDICYYKGYWMIGVRGPLESGSATIYWKRTKSDIFTSDTGWWEWENLPGLTNLDVAAERNTYFISVLQG